MLEFVFFKHAHHCSLFKEHNLIRQSPRLDETVRYRDNAILLFQSYEKLLDFRGRVKVKRRGGLVHKKDFGFKREASRKA